MLKQPYHSYRERAARSGMGRYTCAYICVQIVLQWTHCKPLISGETHLDVKKIITNVNMIAIFLGIVIFALGNKAPEGRSGRY